MHVYFFECWRIMLLEYNNAILINFTDYSRHNSPEYNRKLMEGIIRPSPSRSGFSTPTNMTPNTRSVLDALKEISRKRIHATEVK